MDCTISTSELSRYLDSIIMIVLVKECNPRIENKMRLLGATGIEDKLQEGVPDAIHRIRQVSRGPKRPTPEKPVHIPSGLRSRVIF